mgnify:CR=1 FL=1
MAGQKNGQEQDINQLRKVRREKLANLQEAGKDPFQITKYDQTHHSLEVKELYNAHEAELLAGRAAVNTEGMDEQEAKQAVNDDYNERREIMDASPIHVSIAGRMMFKRVMGKASFCNIQDLDGSIQVYVARDVIGTDAYADFKKSDIGDIYGVKGYAFRTKTGEVSIHAEEMTLLSKSLQILPEKFHGMTNTDLRYRQRYVDLIMNPEVRKAFVTRTKMLAAIRQYYTERGFLEVETPVLQPLYGGANARPFISHLNALDMTMYLRIAPELYLKRLLVGGVDRNFEITRNFRNEGMDAKHNPEFTAMESYQAYGDIEDAIKQTEDVVALCAQIAHGSTRFMYEGIELDVTPPWPRMTMAGAVLKYTGEDFGDLSDITRAREIADRLNVEYGEFDGAGKILANVFDEYVEDKLVQPCHITMHPIEVSPLSKLNGENPRLTDRFESYMFTRELANGFSELNDPLDQRKRFELQQAERDHGDDEAHPVDEDFMKALEYGMPPTAGLGIGLDRLFMFMTGAHSIRDIILFPMMRPAPEGEDD